MRLLWITDGLGRRERQDALAMYLAGLLLDGERKSIQPMASRLVRDEQAIEPLRQRLQQAVAVASWAEGTIYQRIAARFDAELICTQRCRKRCGIGIAVQLYDIMKIRLSIQVSLAVFALILIHLLLVRTSSAEPYDDRTEMLIGLIARLHADHVPMDRLADMLDSQGAINPISEQLAARNAGWRVYHRDIADKLTQRDVLDWGVIRQQVQVLLHGAAESAHRRGEDAAQTDRPWHEMNFIDIVPGQLPDPDNDSLTLENKSHFRVMDSSVTQWMSAKVVGDWPEQSTKGQSDEASWWGPGRPVYPDNPVVQWSFIGHRKRNNGRLLLDRLNAQHRIRGWRYDVPTRDERRYIVSAALHELQQKFPYLFWYTGREDATSPLLYGAYFNQSANDNLCAVKSRLPLHIDAQPIWDLFGLVDDFVYRPLNRYTYGCGTRGGDNLYIPTNQTDADNHWLSLNQDPGPELAEFVQAEQQARSNPYRFWVRFLNKVHSTTAHGSLESWPVNKTGLRLVLRRTKESKNYYMKVDI